MNAGTERAAKLAQIREAFGRALDLPPAARDALFATLPQDVRDEVISLLAAHDSAGPFLGASGDALLSCGEHIGPYRVVELIGQGGMGNVYRAIRDDGEFQREVALKLVGGRLFAAEVERRFISERRILALLNHPNIVRMFDGGVWHGQRYLVMELVSGEPVTTYCARLNLPLADRLRIFQEICSAIHYAHQHMVIHRDLKPGNILITAERQVRVLDFGIARLLEEDGEGDTATTLLNPFTLACASPEQVRGEPLTLATDVYSLGLLLYELLCGRNPHGSGARSEIERRILDEEPASPGRIAPGVPRDLDAIVLKSLAKEPARRYATVERLSSDIGRYLNGLPVSAGPDSFFYRARKFAARRKLPLVAAAAVLAAVTGGAISTLSQSRRAERRFNEVRGLVHSSLFEVYDSIAASPGTLAARRLLAQRAQQYLDGLARETAGDSSLTRELAAAYARLGDVQGRPYKPNLGETAAALESYRKAAALLETESARHPADLALQNELAENYMNMAAIVVRQHKDTSGIAISRQAIAAAERLTARDPRNAEYTEKLAHAYMRLGEAQDVAARRDQSLPGFRDVLATYRKSLAILEAAGPHDEEFFQDRLRAIYFFIGYALLSLGDHTGQTSYYREALDSSLKGDAVNRRLLAAYPHQYNRRTLADGLADIAKVRWKCCRDLAGALRDNQDALDRFQQLADEDPQNLEARRDLANAHNGMGMILGEAGRWKEALESDRKALAIYESVSRTDPDSQEDAQYVATMRARIAVLSQRHQH